jgi:hypothetical protein
MDHGAIVVACLGSLARGPWLVFQMWHKPKMIWDALFTGLAHEPIFLIFPKLNQVSKL